MSPEVWKDVKALITAIAAQVNIAVEWPNQTLVRSTATAPWVSVETAAESAEAIELGNAVWEERGTIWMHFMVPQGSGIDLAQAMRKAFSVAFRIAQPIEGLYYREHSFDPMSQEDGLYRRLSLMVRYDWVDIVNPHLVFAQAALRGSSS